MAEDPLWLLFEHQLAANDFLFGDLDETETDWKQVLQDLNFNTLQVPEQYELVELDSCTRLCAFHSLCIYRL